MSDDTNTVLTWGEYRSVLAPVVFVGLAVMLYVVHKVLGLPSDGELAIPRLDVEHYCKHVNTATSPELCITGGQIFYDRLKSVWSSVPMSVRKCCVESNPNGDYWDLGVCIGLFRNFGYYPMGNETSRCSS